MALFLGTITGMYKGRKIILPVLCIIRFMDMDIYGYGHTTCQPHGRIRLKTSNFTNFYSILSHRSIKLSIIRTGSILIQFYLWFLLIILARIVSFSRRLCLSE